MNEEQRKIAKKAIKLLDGMSRDYQFMFLSDVWEVPVSAGEFSQDDVYNGWEDEYPGLPGVTMYENFRNIWFQNCEDEIRGLGEDDPTSMENDYIVLSLDSRFPCSTKEP